MLDDTLSHGHPLHDLFVETVTDAAPARLQEAKGGCNRRWSQWANMASRASKEQASDGHFRIHGLSASTDPAVSPAYQSHLGGARGDVAGRQEK
jgi:hypothetical protein